jgi:D-3-phosphoglycerate dehydrogenase
VAIVDRHAWYVPAVEEEVLAAVGARVEVSWARVADRPAEADAGRPADAAAREHASRISAAFVPPGITTEDRVIEMARNADAILVVRANMSARVLDALPRLRVIGRYGIGVDNIDLDAADARGIAVVNAPGFCAREVADHTMALLLACSRKVEPLHAALMRGDWGRNIASPMHALYTRTLGLVGFGQIGREVAKRAQAFGITVLAHDPLQDAAAIRVHGAEPAALDDLLARSDFVSLHLPLLPTTKHLVGAKALAAMKPTAFVINTSRGPLIDEAALAGALAARRIAGAALDVFEVEPLPADSPLRKLPGVLLTPHVGGLSDEGQVVLRRMVAGAMADVLAGRWPTGPELAVPRDDAGKARAQARFDALAQH